MVYRQNRYFAVAKLREKKTLNILRELTFYTLGLNKYYKYFCIQCQIK